MDRRQKKPRTTGALIKLNAARVRQNYEDRPRPEQPFIPDVPQFTGKIFEQLITPFMDDDTHCTLFKSRQVSQSWKDTFENMERLNLHKCNLLRDPELAAHGARVVGEKLLTPERIQDFWNTIRIIHRLIEFHAPKITPDWDVINSLTRLETLSVQNVGDTMKRIKLPNLRNLTLSDVDTSHGHEILKNIPFDQLTKLTFKNFIIHHHNTDASPLHTLFNYVGGINVNGRTFEPSIRSLTVHGTQGNRYNNNVVITIFNEYVNAIANLRHLEELRLPGIGIGFNLIPEFIASLAQLPHLRILELDLVGYLEPQWLNIESPQQLSSLNVIEHFHVNITSLPGALATQYLQAFFNWIARMENLKTLTINLELSPGDIRNVQGGERGILTSWVNLLAQACTQLARLQKVTIKSNVFDMDAFSLLIKAMPVPLYIDQDSYYYQGFIGFEYNATPPKKGLIGKLLAPMMEFYNRGKFGQKE